MTIAGSEIEYDDDATRAMYAEVPGGINACTCAECGNYRRVRDLVYPTGFRKMLSTLGIDGTKEIELTHWSGPDDSADENPADGNFAFVGRILSGRPGTSRRVQDPFDFWVDDDLHPTTRATFPDSGSLVDLHFYVADVPSAEGGMDSE